VCSSATSYLFFHSSPAAGSSCVPAVHMHEPPGLSTSLCPGVHLCISAQGWHLPGIRDNDQVWIPEGLTLFVLAAFSPQLLGKKHKQHR